MTRHCEKQSGEAIEAGALDRLAPLATGAGRFAQAGRSAPIDSFAHVDTWVFDLDNTLYPASCDLWPKIDHRITLYMIRMFGLDGVSCRALQKHYYHRYGTTLRGLMTEHGTDADAFLSFVHDVDRSSLPPAPALASAIAALPGRKLILTNGSRRHALETARRLGVDHLFEDIFDIIAADFVAKPHEEAYLRFFDRHAVEPARAALFEDLARNLVFPHARGMTTVLVTPAPGGEDRRESWEIAHGREPHVDFSTSDLAAFLRGLSAR
ncbi:pyrimidine 5'-nucleotidase [Methylosinus sp. Sm6]|uniref:pyrimidine 5'-nucleotidase n=1 Tax=Methylosinus sp. Sm6 TaxID=2866948 RepID=UPI001C997FE9|nr:pyrimidine 5'-nucleotidase [Methylosinus sp. Sm6]MBY6239963.1 pyrimidine 5'-nucleotidase [Methylosinus sp. Sm6]